MEKTDSNESQTEAGQMKISYSSIWEPNLQNRMEVTHSPLTIGRDSANDICLASPLVPPNAAQLVQENNVWRLEVIAGTAKIGEVEVRPGKAFDITGNCSIELGPYLVSLTMSKEAARVDDPRAVLDHELNRLLRQIHQDLFKILDLGGIDESRRNSSAFIETVERKIAELAADQGLFQSSKHRLMLHAAGSAIRSQLLEGLESGRSSSSFWATTDSWGDLQTLVPEHERDASQKVSAVLALLKSSIDNVAADKKLEAAARAFWPAWELVAAKSFPESLHYLAAKHLKKQLKDTLFGYGPLEDLLRSSAVSEIMVVDSDHIYVERDGQLLNSGRRFLNDRVTESVIQRIVAKVGRRIDKAKPLVDARLPDGSRVNAVIPPIAVRGPCLTIRKFPQQSLRIGDLVKKGSLTESARSFLKACVKNKCNILISGGTGSGKTTLLNCLTEFFDEQERVITIEDTAELQVLREHVVGLETKQENIEGIGAYSIRELVKNALRMRPNRIIVGEVRGGEAVDMLQAMNTGHSGSLATIHSNSPEDALLRLEGLVAADSKLPVLSIRQQIVSAIHLVVQLNRVGKKRLLTGISEVEELDPETMQIRTRSLFDFREVASNIGDAASESKWELRPTGRLPTFIAELISKQVIEMSAFLSV
jgi:Flp pilus assembly CpaF family ATPase